jgi:hypothetical protein
VYLNKDMGESRSKVHMYRSSFRSMSYIVSRKIHIGICIPSVAHGSVHSASDSYRLSWEPIGIGFLTCAAGIHSTYPCTWNTAHAHY